MVLFVEWFEWLGVLDLCSVSLQDDTPVSWLLGGEWNKYVFEKYTLIHGTAARMVTSGHPPESKTKVLTYGHSPGPLKQGPLRRVSYWCNGCSLSGISHGRGGVVLGVGGAGSTRTHVRRLSKQIYCCCPSIPITGEGMSYHIGSQ